MAFHRFSSLCSCGKTTNRSCPISDNASSKAGNSNPIVPSFCRGYKTGVICAVRACDSSLQFMNKDKALATIFLGHHHPDTFC